jgi:energy-coupling factor transporter ATP-binding protein EcfA2
MPLVEVSHLWYAYPDGTAALRDVSLSLDEGERVGLAGPNGAGKSTLLWHLNGLLPDEPGWRNRARTAAVRGLQGRAGQGGAEHTERAGDRGNSSAVHNEKQGVWHGESEGGTGRAGQGGGERAYVRIAGLELVPENVAAVRQMVGLVFQDPDDQLFSPTVGEDVAFGPVNLGLPPDEVRRRVAEALEAVGLEGYQQRFPHRLSVGERKRACLAGVLACRPQLLALDEPTANLDPRCRRQLLGLLQRLDCAQLVATHDLELLLELCPRTILLDQGRVCADGPTHQLLADATLLAAHGLEVPPSLRRRSWNEKGSGP